MHRLSYSFFLLILYFFVIILLTKDLPVLILFLIICIKSYKNLIGFLILRIYRLPIFPCQC